MTRSRLIQLLAEKQQTLSYRETENIVRDIFEQMADALGAGKRIEIRGFGSFSIRFKKPRAARNPKTGDRIQKGGKYAPYFRPGKELRERVNLSAKDYPLVKDSEDKDEE